MEDVGEALDDLVAAAVEAAHVVAVDEVDGAVLAGADHFVWVGAALVGEQQHPAGAEVEVPVVEGALDAGGEVVLHGPAWREPDERVAVVGSAAVGVHQPVAADEVEAAGGVGGDPVAVHPDAAVVAVGGGAVDQHPLQRRGVVAEHPAVERFLIAVAGEADIDDAVCEQSACALVLAQGVEGEGAAGGAVAAAGHARLDHDRAAELLGAGAEVERVQALHVAGRAAAHFLGLRNDVDRAGCLIDHRCPGDPDLVGDVAGLAGVGGRHGRDAGGRVGEAVVPERRAAAAVGVEGVDAVVFGRRDRHVVEALAGDVHVLDVQRRGQRQPVERIAEALAEAGRLHVRGGQRGLVQVLARAQVVVVVGEHALIVAHVGHRLTGRPERFAQIFPPPVLSAHLVNLQDEARSARLLGSVVGAREAPVGPGLRVCEVPGRVREVGTARYQGDRAVAAAEHPRRFDLATELTAASSRRWRR